MSEALPLPPRLNLDYYRRLARELRDAAGRGAVHTWADRWITNLTKLVPIEPFGERVPHSRVVEGIEQQWKRFVEQRPPLKADPASMQVSDAQFFLARLHGFASWPRFSHHLQTMTAGDAIAVTFESAVDAIVSGDLDGLRVMLDAHPDLVNRRSAREHHSTLLHYVSANGVEDFRQRTPPNIVAITKLLLERGADVNAESEAYGGHSTTLGLTSTSIHPERAGVMIAMLELLLGTGANRAARKAADCPRSPDAWRTARARPRGSSPAAALF